MVQDRRQTHKYIQNLIYLTEKAFILPLHPGVNKRELVSLSLYSSDS